MRAKEKNIYIHLGKQFAVDSVPNHLKHTGAAVVMKMGGASQLMFHSHIAQNALRECFTICQFFPQSWVSTVGAGR